MIRGSDGFDYENITERIVGNPLPTYRNSAIQSLRARQRPQDEVQVFIQAYDREFERSQLQDLSTEWVACNRAEQAVLAYRQERRLAERLAADGADPDRSSPG